MIRSNVVIVLASFARGSIIPRPRFPKMLIAQSSSLVFLVHDGTNPMMNRIQLAPSSPATSQPALNIGRASFRGGSTADAYSLFAPVHYEAHYAYPLLVWFHGPGADENQLRRIMPLLSMQNFVAVAPRGTTPLGDNADTARRYTWTPSPPHLAAAEDRMFNSIEAASRQFNVASDRVFLAGFDAGGTMAYRLALSYPDRFAGVMSLGGSFPAEESLFSRLDEVRRLPLFLGCGRGSTTLPSEAVCDDLRLFHSAGLNITLRQYPCCHEISPDMLADMNRWMMEQLGL
jgi:phospholipase/carboxylesterase